MVSVGEHFSDLGGAHDPDLSQSKRCIFPPTAIGPGRVKRGKLVQPAWFPGTCNSPVAFFLPNLCELERLGGAWIAATLLPETETNTVKA